MGETPSFRARALLFGFIAVIFLAVLGTGLWAEFYVIEDHLLVVGREWGLSRWMTRIVTDVEAFQRVRPAYWLYIAAGDQVLGTNPHAWHAVTLSWGVLTTYLFAVSLRRLGTTWIAISVFVLVMLLGGTQNWIWVSLIPQETTGMGMTAIAVWAIVLRTAGNRDAWWDGVALLAITIAGLVKESFIILIPALLLLRVTMSVHAGGGAWMAAVREARWVLFGGMTVLVVQLGFVVAIVRSQPAGYSATTSGMSLASLSPSRFLGMVASVEAAIDAVLVASACAAVWLDRSVRRSVVIAAVTIAVLWVGPQLVLYSNAFTGRYLFPSVAGVAGLIALALSVLLCRPRLRVVSWIAMLMMLPFFGNGMTATTMALTSFKAETVSTARAIRFVADKVPSTEAVLIATDSGTGYGFESTYSVPMYAGLAGSRSAFYLWPLLSRGPRSALHIAASKDNTAFKYPDSMMARDAGAILIMDRGIPSFDPETLNMWLAGTSWREVSFSEPYYTWSWSAPLRHRIGAVTQRMLLQSFGAAPEAPPLVRVDEQLNGTVSVAPLLDLPPWGMETDANAGSIVWIGHGDDESVAGVLSAEAATRVELVCDIQPGPSLPGARRTVELVFENGADRQVQHVTFEGAEWRFSVPLQPGATRFRLRVVDAPTVHVQPNGDTRDLMALLHQLAIRPAR